MKIEDLAKMTKTELEDLADTLGLQLDPAKMKKAEMVAAINEAPDPVGSPGKAHQTFWIVTSEQQNPVLLTVNGFRLIIPVGQPVILTDAHRAALDAALITYEEA